MKFVKLNSSEIFRVGVFAKIEKSYLNIFSQKSIALRYSFLCIRRSSYYKCSISINASTLNKRVEEKSNSQKLSKQQMNNEFSTHL